MKTFEELLAEETNYVNTSPTTRGWSEPAKEELLAVLFKRAAALQGYDSRTVNKYLKGGKLHANTATATKQSG